MATEPDNATSQFPPQPSNPMTGAARGWLAAYLLFTIVLLLYLLGKFWPADFTTQGLGAPQKEVLFGFLNVEVKTSAEIRMLVLVLCAGALGAMVHAVQSFVDFHGNQRLAESWLPWYLLRPFVGALLALIFYMLVRGGLVTGGLSSGGSQTVVSVVGLLGAAALVGMFSDLASLKLKEVFTTIFATALKTPRSDPLQGGSAAGKPEITSLKPDKLKVASPGQAITVAVAGRNFGPASKVTIDGKERATKFVSARELSFVTDAADAAAQADLKVVVRNPAASGGDSDPKTLPVTT